MKLDHRVIYLVFIILMAIPFLMPLGLPIEVTDPVQDAYDTIDSVAPGSLLLIGLDFRLMSWSEMGAGTIDMMQQIFNMPVKFVIISLIPEGPMLSRKVIAEIDEDDKVYGEDWVLIGYVPGREAACSELANDFKGVVQTDIDGTSLDSLPLTKDITGASDFDLIVTFEDEGTPWLLYWTVPYGVPIVKTGQALLVPGWLPYYNAGQMAGYVGGIRGYAEYESVLGIKGEPVSFMDSINLAFTYLIALMVIANIIFWMKKREKKG